MAEKKAAAEKAAAEKAAEEKAAAVKAAADVERSDEPTAPTFEPHARCELTGDGRWVVGREPGSKGESLWTVVGGNELSRDNVVQTFTARLAKWEGGNCGAFGLVASAADRNMLLGEQRNGSVGLHNTGNLAVNGQYFARHHALFAGGSLLSVEWRAAAKTAIFYVNGKELHRGSVDPQDSYRFAVYGCGDGSTFELLDEQLAAAAFDARAFLEAALNGRAAVLRSQLRAPDAAVDVRGMAGHAASPVTALFYASWYGQAHCVRLLLGAKASVDSRDSYNATPLILAAANCSGHDLRPGESAPTPGTDAGRVEAARLLIAAGADLGARNGGGHSAVDYAKRFAANGSQSATAMLQVRQCSRRSPHPLSA